MWSEFEWENKVARAFVRRLVTGRWVTLVKQVIICTTFKDTVEFLDHIMHVTNMSCLTPRTLLQVLFSCARHSGRQRVPYPHPPVLHSPLPHTAFADRLPIRCRKPLRQEREAPLAPSPSHGIRPTLTPCRFSAKMRF
jgi:hypothetical protein